MVIVRRMNFYKSACLLIAFLVVTCINEITWPKKGHMMQELHHMSPRLKFNITLNL